MVIPTTKSFAREVSEGLSRGVNNLAQMQLKNLMEDRIVNKFAPVAQQYGIPKEILYGPQGMQNLITKNALTGSGTSYIDQLMQPSPDRQSDYTQSPTYQSQVLKNMERRLSRIIGNNKSLAAPIAESAYDIFDQSIQSGLSLSQALQKGIQAARKTREDLMKTKQPRRKTIKKNASLLKKLKTSDIDKYLQAANFDPIKAREQAKADGFEV